jgi:hypothetical protein
MSKKAHTPLRHTLVHIGAATFVLLVAFIVSLIGKATFGPEVQLAQTSGGFTTTQTFTTEPNITSISVMNFTPTSVEIRWLTDQPSDSRVFYSQDTASQGGQVSLVRCDEGGYVFSHCVLVGGLSPGTTYFYKVESRNSSGLNSFQYGSSFTTPIASGPSATATSFDVSTATNTTTNNTTNTTTETVRYVSFAVALPPDGYGRQCVNGQQQTEVAFFASPPEGGMFTVIRLEDSYSWTIGPVPTRFSNGSYRWVGVPADGFRIGGTAEGSFQLTGVCSTTTVNPTTAPVAPNTTSAVEPASFPMPSIPRVFMENVLVDSGENVKGVVELRITSVDSMKVEFFDMASGARILLGRADVDQVLSSASQDVWTYFWDTKTYANRLYRINARIVETNGTVLETLPIEIKLVNPTTNTLTTSTQAITTASGTTEATTAKIVAPSACSSPKECETYCKSTTANRELCERYVSRELPPQNPPAKITESEPPQSSIASSTDSSLQPTEEPIADATASFVNYFVNERSGARAFLDLDDDGISDFDEINLYGTDPSQYDSDGDGAPDGAELLARTNPVGDLLSEGDVSIGEQIILEDPKEYGVLAPDILTISTIRVVATTTTPDGKPKAEKIAFSGYGLPNSFVTIFIFSDPIVVTVKTDDTGAWVYTLDRELPDGAHEVLTTIVDAGGKIVAKSGRFNRE